MSEEVQLSEKLLDLHPWHKRLGYLGLGEKQAQRRLELQEPQQGKSKIAFCGYHGWHDWYLAENIKDKTNLTNHLMPGLSPNGVPKELKNTSIPFEYNNFEQLEKISSNHDLAAVKMEVQRNFPPKKFLERIRNL